MYITALRQRGRFSVWQRPCFFLRCPKWSDREPSPCLSAPPHIFSGQGDGSAVWLTKRQRNGHFPNQTENRPRCPCLKKWLEHISITEYVLKSSGWDHSPEPSPFFILLFFLLLLYFVFRFFSGLLIGMYHTILFHPWPRFLSCTTSIMFFMLSFELFFPGQPLLCIFFLMIGFFSCFIIFYTFLWLPARITSSDVSSCMTYYVNRVLLQILWSCFVFPYIYH